MAEYEAELAAAPASFRRAVERAWGEPAADPAVHDGAFLLPLRAARQADRRLQPDRGDPRARKGDYHDLALPPRHAYVAFYLWLPRASASTR